MVDTKRTVADMLANLFQDGQAAASITAQDIRDFLVSVHQSHGSFSRNATAATTITVAGTYYKAAGTTTIDTSLHDFSDGGVDNRLKYTGTPSRHVNIAAALSMTCGGSNQILGFKLAKNGVVIDNSVARRKIGTGSDIGGIGVHAHVDMVTDDYIELWCTNETSTATVTIEEVHLMATGLID